MSSSLEAPGPSLVATSIYIDTDDGRDTVSMSSSRSLSDVPEEGPLPPMTPDPSSAYFPTTIPTNSSTTTLNPPQLSHRQPSITSNRSGTSKKSSSSRGLSRTSSETLPGSSKRTTSSSGSSVLSAKDGKSKLVLPTTPKLRTTPRLPFDKDIELAPSTAMYWSRAPVYGEVPSRCMRGHTVTVVDSTAWVFGGCDDNKETSREMYCFDIGAFHTTHNLHLLNNFF